MINSRNKNDPSQIIPRPTDMVLMMESHKNPLENYKVTTRDNLGALIPAFIVGSSLITAHLIVGIISLVVTYMVVLISLVVHGAKKRKRYTAIPMITTLSVRNTDYDEIDQITMLRSDGTPMTNTFDMSKQILDAQSSPELTKKIAQLLVLKHDILRAYGDDALHHGDLVAIDMKIKSLCESHTLAIAAPDSKQIALEQDIAKRFDKLVITS